MLIQMIRFVLILAAAIGGYHAAQAYGWPGTSFNNNFAIILYMILGSAIGYVAGGILGRRLAASLVWAEETLQNLPLSDLLMGFVGLLGGLTTAFLLTLPLAQIQLVELRLLIITFVYIFLAFLGLRLGKARGAELGRVFGLQERETATHGFGADKLLDTNIVIDGRIVDLAAAGFIEGRLIVPRFVLKELHLISDSADALKRNRGRRGLDVLNELRNRFAERVEIMEKDYPEIIGVDGKLVRLAKETHAVIMTNDYNLNKVASLEGVTVLNLNDLANAVKPIVLPGEELEIKIVHEGKEAGQGVGYLEDGTMVVVEGGKEKIGENVELKITSMLQTSAGKMIFSRLKQAV